MMDRIATEAVEGFVHAGYDLTAEAILLCESDGTPDEVADEMARVSDVLRKAGATDIKVSQNEAGGCVLSGRKNAFPATGRSPTTTAWTAPSRARSCRAWLKRDHAVVGQVRPALHNVFHAGDGNLHPLIACSTPTCRARLSVPRSSARRSSNSASRSAAPSR